VFFATCEYLFLPPANTHFYHLHSGDDMKTATDTIKFLANIKGALDLTPAGISNKGMLKDNKLP
jgi:hypothetical protein